MVEDNISLEFRLKNIGETRNDLLEEIVQNELMRKSTKGYNAKLYWNFSYFSFCNHWMYFNFCFRTFAGISTETTISAIGLKICAITAETKKYKSIIKK